MKRKYLFVGLALTGSMAGCYTGIETRPRDRLGYYPDKIKQDENLIERYKMTSFEEDFYLESY